MRPTNSRSPGQRFDQKPPGRRSAGQGQSNRLRLQPAGQRCAHSPARRPRRRNCSANKTPDGAGHRHPQHRAIPGGAANRPRQGEDRRRSRRRRPRCTDWRPASLWPSSRPGWKQKVPRRALRKPLDVAGKWRRRQRRRPVAKHSRERATTGPPTSGPIRRKTTTAATRMKAAAISRIREPYGSRAPLQRV